uniref:Bifunctional glutamate/proline--tRNA ligase n=1 Tax=Aceria tosichella TaxID=561515 RepID=A0A6G1SK46_9ACAR
MDSGIYTELENAVKGQVVVRFPPEASGFLHIGHAKAALLNYHYKTIYDGKFIMRFDDTNPEKEKEDFEEAIMNDVRSLGIQWDHFSYTSDHFDLLMEKCVEMIKNGHAYVDDTPSEEMRLEREKRLESKCRSQSVEENLKKWDQMVSGSEEGQKCCVRAKIDYQSKNGCLRDPVIYRCKNEPHPRHGTKYKVYPTYDFACPIVDSVEGVTHSLRTSEYIDRDPQFNWFCETLGLRKPNIAAYSRLNMMNTVLSKRKLTYLVEEKIVDGWDDPRMPTVQGVLRRGLTVEGLKRFIIAQGSSKHIVFMEWDKIWAFNKKYLDPIVPRFTAIEQKDAVTVTLDGYDGQLTVDLAVHPKDPSMGVRKVKVSKELLVEQVDAAQMKEGDSVTLLSIGNVKVSKIDKNEQGVVVGVTVTLDLENKDYKKTLKVSWLNKDTVQLAKLFYFDHIITKSVLDKDEDFKAYVNRDSKVEVMAYVEPDCKDLKARTIIQFTRKGNFICDSPYDPATNTMVFNYIPDGTSKNPYTTVVVSSSKTPKETSSKPKKEPKQKQQVPVDPAKEAENLKKQQEKAEVKAKKKEAHKAGKKGPEAGGDQKAKATQETGRQTKLAIGAKKEENFSDWYTEVITKSEMVEYYDVSGCYIFRPWSYAIWERIQSFFDAKIKAIGVENCYFPIFVSQNALEREKNHIADFAPEVAWVTRSGQSELAEPIAIRPTSETVMYPAFAKWVQSHRDLPIRLNQWNNVVRWEFKDPTPFIRTREFLWQEGHTAFATHQEALEEVEQILEFYASVYEDLLAIPVVRGRKSEKEKFPGADFTLTVEGYISANGRGIQGATSHHLGQNFSKMFDISFQSTEDSTKREYAHQNSWGLSTRTIGVLVMTHSDNKGLVLPPRVSPLQVVVIPVGITVSIAPEIKSKLYEHCDKIHSELTAAGIRSKLDKSDFITPGRKFNYYEQKGVCIRVELGPKDLEKSQAVVCRRDTGDKVSVDLNGIAASIAAQLDEMQSALYAKAKHAMDIHQVQVTDWNNFLAKLNEKCTLVAPFCGRPACEDNIKKDSVRESTDGTAGPLMGAKSLCIPKRQPDTKLDGSSKCIHPGCSEKPQFWTLFGRSY